METYRPTSRVLATLELLQSRRRITGAEIAERLEVSPRTARRYVETIRELGVPVEGERGRYGAYYLRPGFKLRGWRCVRAGSRVPVPIARPPRSLLPPKSPVR
jgi:predicted DNA-binding transcriptional regulator YafY